MERMTSNANLVYLCMACCVYGYLTARLSVEPNIVFGANTTWLIQRSVRCGYKCLTRVTVGKVYSRCVPSPAHSWERDASTVNFFDSLMSTRLITV